MNRILQICIVTLVTSASAAFAQSPSVFRHPGVMSSQAELDFIKTSVSANAGSPIVAGYNILAGDSRANLNYNPEPYAVVYVVASGSSPEEDAFRRDAHAAYAHAIRWVVTSNVQHRNKAVQILNVWASTFQRIVGDKPNQPTLEASWALPIWVAAAEIIKTYNNGAAGWAATDVTKFNTFVRNVLNYVNGPLASAPNWIISKDLSLMSAGVFLNDASLYNAGYADVLGQFDAIEPNGRIPEIDRDFVHSQYVLIGLAQCAEVAHQQGDDRLFTRRNDTTLPELLNGTETYVKGLLGTGTPNYQAESAWARKSAPYEILLSRYTQLGFNVPQTRNYILNQNRPETAIENHFVGWFTATHGELPPNTPPPCVPVSASTDDGNVPANVLDGDLNTRWSAEGDGQWLQFCLGTSATVSGVKVAFYNGTTRTSRFDVQVSGDGRSFTNAAANLVSSGTSAALETFTFAPKTAKYIRIVGHGNSVNAWNSYTEVSITTTALAAPIGQTVWLQGPNNQYVSSKNGDGPMWCNATAVQGWNGFLVVDAGNGKVALQNQANYVSSENGTQPMTCNRATFQDWETFEWIFNADGTVSLRGNNGAYVSSENAAVAMTCTRTAITSSESFRWGVVTGTTSAQAASVTTLHAYPNPVIDQLTYTVTTREAYHIDVKRADGVVIYSAHGQGQQQYSLDATAWPRGTYYGIVTQGNITQTFRIVKP